MIPADELFAPSDEVRKRATSQETFVDQPRDSGDGVRLDSIPDAIAAIRAGKSVVVIDDEDRENQGDT